MAVPGNSNNMNVVAVEKDGRVTGHLPRSVAIVRFLKRKIRRNIFMGLIFMVLHNQNIKPP